MGQYQVNANVIVKVSLEGSKLMVQSPLGSFELLPENESDFFTREDRRATYRFLKNEKGEVTELALSLNGNQNIRAKKVEK